MPRVLLRLGSPTCMEETKQGWFHVITNPMAIRLLWIATDGLPREYRLGEPARRDVSFPGGNKLNASNTSSTICKGDGNIVYGSNGRARPVECVRTGRDSDFVFARNGNNRRQRK